MITKTITLTPSSIRYEGDSIGRDFIFVVLIQGQEYLYRSFRQKIGHGETISIIGQSLGLHLSFDESERTIHIPVAIMAAELDPTEKEPASRFLGASTTDFGLNAAFISFEFTLVYDYPHTFAFEMPVQVQGDFWAERGREKHKTAHLIFSLDVEVNWDTTQMELGTRIFMDYQSGRRSFNGDVLQQINLAGVAMPGTDFGEANLLWANLEGADLYRSDFTLAILRAANLRSTKLENANLSEANLAEAVLDEANLRNADLTYAVINSSFIGCEAVNANFTGAQIHSSNFKNADLTGALFREAKLEYVDFRNANLRGADFTGAQIDKINYEGADLTGAIGLYEVPSTNFDPVDPFEGKSEAYRKGYQEGYERGYQYAIDYPVFDEMAWEKSLINTFNEYSQDFAEGYKIGFMQTYNESLADAG